MEVRVVPKKALTPKSFEQFKDALRLNYFF
jgi:hypothetical protein